MSDGRRNNITYNSGMAILLHSVESLNPSNRRLFGRISHSSFHNVSIKQRLADSVANILHLFAELPTESDDANNSTNKRSIIPCSPQLTFKKQRKALDVLLLVIAGTGCSIPASALMWPSGTAMRSKHFHSQYS